MAPDLASGRRKRARPQIDEDASSPAPAADVASSAKKRRLNAVTASSPSTPKGFSALTSAIGGMLGFGRRTSAEKANPSSENPQDGKTKSVYDDIPGSTDNEEAIPAQTKPRIPAVHYKKFGLKPPTTRQPPNKPTPKSATAKNVAPKSVYDVPSSGDEHEIPVTVDEQPKSQDGTPRKSRHANGTSKPATSSGKRTSTRSRAIAQNEKDQAREEEEVSQETPSKTRARRQATLKVEGASGKRVTTAKPAVKQASAKQGGSLLEDSAKKQPPTPKGILTPRHKKSGRPRKSVAFDSEDNKPTAEVYFEDLPSKSKPPVSRPKVADKASEAEAQGIEATDEEDDEDGDDEEVCTICSKPDSEPPNEIIFCENCDKAVHQKCYNVPVIPEDDWFCRDCLQEDVVSSAKDSETLQEVGVARDIPDIPNFEQHLRVMQRVLIDRCSGNRRIKLKGQDEAYEKAFQLVEQTVLAGEGNSMMVIGARGCGKTTVSF
jgi:origin recognition complex subunit 4